MTTPPSPTPVPAPDPQAESLPRHYGVALGVVLLGLGCLALLPLWGGALWLSLGVSLLGLFLVLQTALLRLEFRLLGWKVPRPSRSSPPASALLPARAQQQARGSRRQ